MTNNNTPVVSIDGRSSKDLDDAFSISTLPDGGGWTLDIFISNVHRTLREDETENLESLLEAAESRVQTLYAGSHSIHPMLPRRLSEDKLSLNFSKHRKALKTTMNISLAGNVEISEISPVTIRNDARLHYGHVTKLSLINEEAVKTTIKTAVSCAEVLYKRRVASHNTLTQYDANQGIFVDEEGNFQKANRDEIHGQILIQEFMILTNVAMTAWANKHDLPIIYRNHTAKDLSSFNQDVQEALRKLPLDEFIKKTRMLCEKAVYGSKNKGHVGLGVPAYATFTSPIRRFPDLHNQRVVNEYLDGIDSAEVPQERCDKLNSALEESDDVKREHSKKAALKKAVLLSKKSPESLTGRQLSMLIKKGDIESANRAMTIFTQREDLNGCIELWLSAISNAAYFGSALKNFIFDELESSESKRRSIWACYAQKNNIHDSFSEALIAEFIFNSTGRHMVLRAETPKEIVDVNYKGKLLEACQKLKLLMPTYDSVNSGEDHLPVWKTTCTLYLGMKPIKGHGKDMSKKASERIASEIVLNSPELKELLEKTNTQKPKAITQVTNPKGMVLELCAAEKIPQPTVTATESESLWSVTLSFERNLKHYTKTSSMASKKQAERDAYLQLSVDLGIA